MFSLFALLTSRATGHLTGRPRPLAPTRRRPEGYHDVFLTSGRAPLDRHERVLGVDAVRVEHVRVAAHGREEHVLEDGRRQ